MRHLALLCTCFLLAACGGKGDGRDDAATADGNLPIPAGTPRSVTGMPDPGRPLAVPREAQPAEAGTTSVEADMASEAETAATDGAEVGSPDPATPVVELAEEPAPAPPTHPVAEPTPSVPPAQ